MKRSYFLPLSQLARQTDLVTRLEVCAADISSFAVGGDREGVTCEKKKKKKKKKKERRRNSEMPLRKKRLFSTPPPANSKLSFCRLSGKLDLEKH
jgi:hypothetical protein